MQSEDNELRLIDVLEKINVSLENINDNLEYIGRNVELIRKKETY